MSKSARLLLTSFRLVDSFEGAQDAGEWAESLANSLALALDNVDSLLARLSLAREATIKTREDLSAAGAVARQAAYVLREHGENEEAEKRLGEADAFELAALHVSLLLRGYLPQD